MISRLLPVLAACLAMPLGAFAHGDLHEQIATVTAQIAHEPRNAELHLKRAELHRAHESWPDAAKDYDRAAALAPELFAVELGRGKMLLASGKPADAVKALDRFIAKKPDFADAFIARARAKAKLAEHAAAAADYAHAIELTVRPEPEFYIERADALAAAGLGPDAVRTLDDGIAKFGPIVTLMLPAIELEVSAKNFDAALVRVDRLTATAPRKETWLARRAEILTAAGRPTEARATCEAALTAIATLPEPRRLTKATFDLRARIEARLKSLATPANPAP